MPPYKKINRVLVVGANPRPGVDLEDYRDWLNSYFDEGMAADEIKNGNFPDGLVMRTRLGLFEVRSRRLEYCERYKAIV
jgi:hypothetical protein